MFWITNRIGTCAEAEETPPGAMVIDVRDLNDGREDPQKIIPKLTIGLIAVKRFDIPTIYRCRMGVSRSNAMAAGVIAILDDKDYMDAIGTVCDKVPRAQPNMEIIDSVHAAVEQLRKVWTL